MYFSKMPVLFVGISLEKLWESLGAKAGLASLKSDSGLGLRSRRLVPCSPSNKSWRLFL